MELDEFLERDMLRFLEEKKEKDIQNRPMDREEDYGLYLTKDYLKEITLALERDEITNAQKIFDDLRNHYETLPKGSLEAKKVYSILEQAYSKISAYNQLKGLTKNIRSFDDALDRGFQGSIQQKVHQTVNKIDKKIDNIDEKIARFGEDFKDLKKKIINSSIGNVSSSEMENKLVNKSAASKLEFLPPKNPNSEVFSNLNKQNNNKITFDDRVSSNSIDIDKKMNDSDSKSIDSSRELPSQENSKLIIKDDTKIEKTDLISKDTKILKPKFERVIELYKVPKNLKSKNYSLKNKGSLQNDSRLHKKRIVINNASILNKKENKSISVFDFNKSVPKDVKISDSNIDLKNNSNVISNKNINSNNIVKEKVREKKLNFFDDLHSAEEKTKTNGSNERVQISQKTREGFNNDLLDYEKKYFDALRLMHLNKYFEAKKLFNDILLVNPNHKPSQIRLKQCQEAIINGGK